ncbi:MAG TPA: ferritin-like domain-containing protein [Methylobacterium sp.]|nr:ferritin-like domain-containing protein [Methylobacterium sp.]
MGSTRAAFFRRGGALVAGGLLAGGIPAAPASARGVPKGDIAILNFALTLEYLEAAFYKQAISDGALRGQYANFAKVVAAHEQAHVGALKQALGAKAVMKPNFDFKGTTAGRKTFAATAMVLEDTGVQAYQGQAGNIKTPAILKAAISIHPVEARHAAWIRSIVGHGSGNPSPAPAAFNPALSMNQVLAAVQGTGFITSTRTAGAGSAVSGQPSMAG